LRARTAYRLRVIVGVTIASGTVGGLFGLRYGLSLASTLGGVASGVVSGFILVLLEQLLQGRARETLCRLPMLAALGLRTVLYSAVFVVGAVAGAGVVRLALPGTPVFGVDILAAGSLAIFVVASLAFNFAFLLRRLPGLPPGIVAEPLGALPLRGKQETIDLFAVSRAAGAAVAS
jgi:hypothetical protein